MCTVENIGNEASSDNVRFYLSTNTTYSADDIYMGAEGFSLFTSLIGLRSRVISFPFFPSAEFRKKMQGDGERRRRRVGGPPSLA